MRAAGLCRRRPPVPAAAPAHACKSSCCCGSSLPRPDPIRSADTYANITLDAAAMQVGRVCMAPSAPALHRALASCSALCRLLAGRKLLTRLRLA